MDFDCRLSVERDDQDLARGDALVPDQMGDLPDYDRGLARSGACEDKRRVLVCRDGLRLFVRQGDIGGDFNIWDASPDVRGVGAFPRLLEGCLWRETFKPSKPLRLGFPRASPG